MKPLPSAPITEEDSWIWGWLYRKHVPTGNALAAVSYHGDRRDADLMFHLERCRAHELAETVDGKPLNGMAYAHSLLRARDWLGIGGEDPFNITNFA